MKGSRDSEASPTELPSDLQEEIEQDELLASDTSGGRHLPLDYHAFFGLAPWPCVVTDTHTVIRQANQAATALFGRLAHAPGGRFLADWIVSRDREAFDHWL